MPIFIGQFYAFLGCLLKKLCFKPYLALELFSNGQNHVVFYPLIHSFIHNFDFYRVDNHVSILCIKLFLRCGQNVSVIVDYCADRENRTPVLSLARIHSTTKLYPQFL